MPNGCVRLILCTPWICGPWRPIQYLGGISFRNSDWPKDLDPRKLLHGAYRYGNPISMWKEPNRAANAFDLGGAGARQGGRWENIVSQLQSSYPDVYAHIGFAEDRNPSDVLLEWLTSRQDVRQARDRSRATSTKLRPKYIPCVENVDEAAKRAELEELQNALPEYEKLLAAESDAVRKVCPTGPSIFLPKLRECWLQTRGLRRWSAWKPSAGA